MTHSTSTYFYSIRERKKKKKKPTENTIKQNLQATSGVKVRKVKSFWLFATRPLRRSHVHKICIMGKAG